MFVAIKDLKPQNPAHDQKNEGVIENAQTLVMYPDDLTCIVQEEVIHGNEPFWQARAHGSELR